MAEVRPGPAGTSDDRGVVIVGGGLAGAKTAQALREKGFAGPITVISAEDDLPYERPPLSKGYLMGEDGFEKALVHPADWYTDNGVELRRSVVATAIDREAREVGLGDGSRVPYSALVLATGSEPRALPADALPPTATPLTLRTRADADRIKATFGEGRRLAVVGGGWIGLEVAAGARHAGTAVTLIEASEQPLLGVLGPEMGKVFADLHRDHGVDVRLGSSDLDDVEADAFVIGVGVSPRVQLAEAAGLEVDNGVLVDASLRTSDPRIFAVGDIANHDHPVLGHRIRVEHWATALNQPAVAAAAIMGEASVYDRLPYFFSDQYDLGMEYLGFARREDTDRVVVRGDLSARQFVAFWLDAQRRILAAMNVNVWDVPDQVRPLIAGKTIVDPDKLADPATPLSDVAR